MFHRSPAWPCAPPAARFIGLISQERSAPMSSQVINEANTKKARDGNTSSGTGQFAGG